MNVLVRRFCLPVSIFFPLLASLVLACPVLVRAQPAQVTTGRRFLAFNRTHQAIFVRELMNGQQVLLAACAAGLSTDDLLTYLQQWIERHPLSLSRPMDIVFQQALDDRCDVLQDEQKRAPDAVPAPADPESSLYMPGPQLADIASSLPQPVLAQGESESPPQQSTENPPEPSFPRLSGILKLGIINQGIVSAADRENQYNDLFADSILNLNLFLTPEIYFNAAARYLPLVFPPVPRRDRAFDDQALVIGALNLSYENDVFLLSAGKGTTFFSTAFRAAPGIWGRDVAERFVRVPVRMGVVTSGKFSTSNVGNHALSAGAFFLDTTPLSEPLFSRFNRPKLQTGGPSNTERLDSFFIVLDSSAYRAVPGLRTQLGFMQQKVDRIQPPGRPEPLPSNLINDEYRAVASAQWTTDLGDDQRLTALLEYARVWNAGGMRQTDLDVLTGGLQYFFGPWNLSLATSYWTQQPMNGNRASNVQAQISGGYAFDNGLSVDVGYRYLDVGSLGLLRTHTLGLWVQYIIGF